jgi:hypothetical protein
VQSWGLWTIRVGFLWQQRNGRTVSIGHFALSDNRQPAHLIGITASSGNEALRTDGQTKSGKQQWIIVSRNFGDHLSGSPSFLTMHSPLEHLFLLCNFAKWKACRSQGQAGRHTYSEGTGWAQTPEKSVKRSVKTAIHDKEFKSVAILLCRWASDVSQSALLNACPMTHGLRIDWHTGFSFSVSQDTAVSPQRNPAPFRTSHDSIKTRLHNPIHAVA